jgi:hypothetical protein
MTRPNGPGHDREPGRSAASMNDEGTVRSQNRIINPTIIKHTDTEGMVIKPIASYRGYKNESGFSQRFQVIPDKHYIGFY